MAQQEEPMDVDSTVCEFDNKENAYQHGNLLPRTPCTEKGYEELDVTELNMKLRYSITPAASPMSKSLTGNIDNRTFERGDENAETNMTYSLHSTLNKNEKLAKSFPLQMLTTDPHLDVSRSILHPLDSTVMLDNQITVTVSTPNETDDLSIPSSTSSLADTPEATTPTKDNTKNDASPLLRGLKSVLNMFRPSQSPIPPEEQNAAEALSPPIVSSPRESDNTQSVLVSTPLAARNTSDMLTKRTSPVKENIVFKEDLEKELLWKDESTIIFDNEKVPLHKLFFQNTNPLATPAKATAKPVEPEHDVNTSVEYMDISYNDSAVDKTLNVEAQSRVDKHETTLESDSEFVDCETTLNKTEPLFSPDTSLESYTSMDVNLDSTKAIVEKLTSLSNDTVNASSDTLEDSTKTADLSNVSVETTKPNNHTIENEKIDQSTGDIGMNGSANDFQMNQVVTTNSDPNNHTIENIAHASEEIALESADDLQKKEETITQEKGVNETLLLTDIEQFEEFGGQTKNKKKEEATTNVEENTVNKTLMLADTEQLEEYGVQAKSNDNLQKKEEATTNVEENAINETLMLADTEQLEECGVQAKSYDYLQKKEEAATNVEENAVNETLILADREQLEEFGVQAKSNDYLQKKEEAATDIEENAVNETLMLADTEQLDEYAGEAKNNAEEAVNAAQVSVSLAETYDYSPIISYPIKYAAKTPAKQNFVAVHTTSKLVDNEVGTPTVDNDSIVFNSLAQIPLIADPRVLLFNISSEMSVEGVNIQKVNSESQPADVPLPDDDEIASLPPFVPSVTEQNVSPSIIAEDNVIVASKPIKISDVGDTNVINSSEVATVESNIDSVEVVAKEMVDETISTQQAVIKSKDIVIPVSEPKEIPASQPVIETEGSSNTPAISEVNDLVDALEVVTRASMAPVIQNLLELDTTKSTEVSKVEDIATFPEFNQTMSEYTSVSDVVITSKKEAEVASLQVSDKIDISMKHNVVVPDAQIDDVTPKPVSIVENDNASIHEFESKPLSINIPRSPKPENYVAPVSDLVIEGSVQETRADSGVSQELELSKSNIQKHIIKTIPASVVAKLNESLDKKEVETRKSNVDLVESLILASHKETEAISDDAQVSINKDSVVTNIVSSEDRVPVENEPEFNAQDAPDEDNCVLDSVPAQETDAKLLKCDILQEIDQKIVHNTEIIRQNETVVLFDNLDCDVTMVDLDPKANGTLDASVKSSEIPEKDQVDGKEQSPIICLNVSVSPVETKEQIDEEIVASENNSPFVSVSAEIDNQLEQIPMPLQDNKVEPNPIDNFEEIIKPFITTAKVITPSTSPRQLEQIPAPLQDNEVEPNPTDNFSKIINPFNTTSRVTPPTSPPIVSKGYSFNFDEIEDPFTTKTNIRQSPSPDSPNQTFSHLDDTLPVAESPKRVSNIIKPYPQKRKPIRVNHKLNATSVAATLDKHKKPAGKSNASPLRAFSESDKDTSKVKDNKNKDLNSLVKLDASSDKLKLLADSKVSQNSINKVVSSGPSKKQINITEIDNPDFNPFATKSKIRQSPPPSLDGTFNTDNISTNTFNVPEIGDPDFNPFATKTKIHESPPTSLDSTIITLTSSPAKTEIHKDNLVFNIETDNPLSPITGETGGKVHSFDNTIKVACLLKSSTAGTTSSVKTEDQDTIEGPFLDDIEFNDDDKMSDFDGDNVGMIEFGDIPSENAENAEGEMFIDAEAFEFLLNQNQTSTVTDSGKESLFLKFDPLFAKRLSAVGVSTFNNIQKRRVTPKKVEKSPQQNLISIGTPQKDSTYVATPQKDATLLEIPQKDAIFVSTPQKDATFVEIPQKDATFVETPQKHATFVEIPQKDYAFVATPQKDATFVKTTQKDCTFVATPQKNATFVEIPQKDCTFVATPQKDATFVEIPQKDCTFVATLQKDATFVEIQQKDATFVTSLQKEITFTATPKQDETMIDDLPQKPTVAAPVLQNATFSDPLAGPSRLNFSNDRDASTGTEESSEDLNATIVKPMMVVNPAVNPITPRVKATTPNRRSLTFTSPAIAVIDRLLSISANKSILGHDTPVRDSQDNHEAKQALTQLRELLADKEIDVDNLRTESKDLRERLGNLESQMKHLETISQERLKNINELNVKLKEKANMNKSMASVVEEYERTIASLITQTEEDKKRHAEERMLLISEREEARSHLASMEVSFSDLHSKYEKSKQAIFGFKANEESLKKSVKEFDENLAKMQTNYETLKQHATAKLNHANDELQKLNRAHEAEVLKLTTMLKRKEVDITSLEETLAQKTKTNEELTAICDSLLAKFA